MENTIKRTFKGFFCSHDWRVHSEKQTSFPSLIILKDNGLVERLVDQTNTTVQILICPKCGNIVKLTF